MQRPRVITILAVLAAIGGVLGLFAALGLIGLGAVSGAALGLGGEAVSGFLVGGFAIFWGLVTLVQSVADLAFAYGAWFLKPWAWMLGIVLQGISIFVALINWVGSSSGSFGSFLFSAVISGVIIYYLLTPEVKRAFGKV
jgi:hypothetical protein